MTHVVVVGAGQAGSACVAKLRNGGFDGEVTLIGAETTPPYQRPPLSKKYLLGEMPLERLLLRPESFYSDNNITLRLGQTVDTVDATAKTLSVGGDILAYDHLVLTTGSAPRRLPAAVGGALDGVYVVRDLADVDAMAPEFAKGKHVLIIGGGYIGLEAAAVAAAQGIEGDAGGNGGPDFAAGGLCADFRFFPQFASSPRGGYPRGCRPEKLNRREPYHRAVLSDGSMLDVDFAIVGVGITPETGLAKMAGVELDNGIKTAASGETSVSVSGLRGIVHPSLIGGNASGWKACQTRLIRRKSWRKISWGPGWTIRQSRGSGRINMT